MNADARRALRDAAGRAASRPGEWSAVGILPYEQEGSTIIIVDDDAPHRCYALKRVWRDEQDRRCTQFFADIHPTPHEGEMQDVSAYIALAHPGAIIELLDALEKAERTVAYEVRRATDERLGACRLPLTRRE